MATFSKFRLDVPRRHLTESTMNDAPSTLFWDLTQSGSSPTSAPSGSQKLYGCFLSDSESGRYPLSWSSWEAFKFLSFLTQEQVANSIELRRVSSTTGAERYLERTVYVCAWYGTWGKKDYEKKPVSRTAGLITGPHCQRGGRTLNNPPVTMCGPSATMSHTTGAAGCTLNVITLCGVALRQGVGDMPAAIIQLNT
ncbi:uncharacterized protein LACBIDRAFT_329015 [Laccaria bicolor S238N-H82]|uniref:Predicted protein n=1 Tax=Laccaria bicolor (strain S238N-H82 / ATCC MYA-4686) TaxID=486041 RepID=B0DGS3_LACBS|nr:uncharacterized protein LACBIDRAFT_329015 [Laccaria bicolor S238N-H82]EDR06201.1 predicted protein [Laccaria bicolor S238N-H82]|eukprot:XP_001883062.1 predicted protein [Laccaria bicolor S238N-H82]